MMSGTISSNAQASSEVSPFLRLAPELREVIYETALGGRIIHVGIPNLNGPGWKMKIVVCAAKVDELDVFDGNGVPLDPSSDVDSGFSRRHSKCFHSKRRKPRWHLLLTCKKIYAESKSAPFSYNTFAFPSPEMLVGFEGRIGGGRFRNMRRLLLYSTNCHGYWAVATPQPSITDLAFGHLQHLDVLMELVPGDFMQQSEALDEVEAQDQALARLKYFHGFAPRRVRVIISDDVTTEKFDKRWPWRQVARQRAAQLDKKAWAERIRRMILPSTEVMGKAE